MLKINNPFKGEVGSLQSDSANVIDVFTKTVSKLQEVNTRINKAWYVRSDKMAVLAKEQELLTAQKESNEKVINKLNSILND